MVEGKRAIVIAMQQRLGEKSPRRRAVVIDTVQQRSLASSATTNSFGLVTALGVGHDFINVDPVEWSGRDDYTTARQRARHLRVVNEFAEGRRSYQRILWRHRARRGTATAPSAGRGAPSETVPMREVGVTKMA